jgi:TRAP-type C4-dicarboxylate transport system substrate-binding protein
MLLQGGDVSRNWASGLFPIFANYDDNDACWREVSPEMSKTTLEPRGAMWRMGVSSWGGPLNLTFPAYEVADFKGKKIRNPGGDYEADLMKALGMSAVSMAQAEVATSLETGVIDGVWTSLRSIMNAKDYKGAAKWVTPNNVPGVSGQTFIMWSLKSWDRFPADVKDKLEGEILEHAMDEAAAAMRKIAETGMEAIIADGAIYCEWTDEATKEYYEIITPVVLKYAANVDPEYIEIIQKYSQIPLK